MTKFTINQAEIDRLQRFSEYLSKLNILQPLNARQLFYLNDSNKLEIYAYGEDGSAGAIQGEITIDLINVSYDNTVSTNFNIELSALIIFLNKLKGSDVNFNLSNSQLFITGNTDSKFSLTLLAKKDDAEVTEIRDFINTQLNLPYFADGQRVDVNITDIKDYLNIVASLTEVFDIHQLVEISESSIKFADNYGVFSKDLVAKPVNQTVHLHRGLVQFFKFINTISFSSDFKFCYLNLSSLGIRALLVSPNATWAYPTEDNLIDLCPKDSIIQLEINSKKFYQILDDFSGVFKDWQYNQINIKTPIDFGVHKELHLNWTSEDREVTTKVPVSIINRTDMGENFEFILTTKELEKIKPFLLKDDNSTFIMEYSSIPLGTPHGSGIKIYSNDGTTIIIPKLNG
jgi:hypothetical protein